jgi:hypothetical protein
MLDFDNFMENLNKVKESVKKVDYVHFLREGQYKGKIIVGRGSKLISGVAPFYRVPVMNQNGEISTRMVRDYPGNPVGEVFKKLTEQGLLAGDGWRYDRKPIAKFLAFLAEAPATVKDFTPGVYVIPLTSKYLLEGYRSYILSLFGWQKSKKELLETWQEMAPYFDPDVPNAGFVFTVKSGKSGSFAVTHTKIIKLPPIEIPSWALESDLDDIWIPTSPDWTPSEEYHKEAERLAEEFYRLGMSGALAGKNERGEKAGPTSALKALSRISGVSAGPQPSSYHNPAAVEEENLPFNRGVASPTGAGAQPRTREVSVVHTDFQGEERFAPDDPRSGGPDAIYLDANGIPICFGHINPSLVKCRSCSQARDCLSSSMM